ncbi:hypothetical protein K5E19_04710, partial [Enterobacter sp. RIT637]|nr:hypothetical protein [Enterobacter sp. RIT637]
IDQVLLDEPNYLLFYSGCTNITSEKGGRRGVSYDILFYSKTFDTLVSINEFTSSETIDNKMHAAFLKNKKDFFVYEKTNIAFKINGKDKVEGLDPDTGLPLNRDDSSDDADGVQVLPLERLPEIQQ